MVLAAKLSALLIVALGDPSNCIFHSASISEHAVLFIRQAVLIVAMTALLVLQSVAAPFMDPVSNASEWVSRAGYVVTAILGVGSVIGGKTKGILEGPILYM